MDKKLIVGLTGGIASGKTTVAEIFRSLGAYVIDADVVGHQVLKNDLCVKQELLTTFGNAILDGKGSISRSKLGCLVFDNREHLETLNQIIHPPIIEAINNDIRDKSSSEEYSLIVVDAALLIELNLTHMVDVVVLVHADEDVQIQRLLQRGLSRDEALKRIRSQMPSQQKKQFSNHVIYNNNLLSEVTMQAKEVWAALNACLKQDG